MNNKTIIVVGYDSQVQTKHQMRSLRAAGADVINIIPYEADGLYGKLVWQTDRVTWQGIDISPDKIDGVLVCGLAPSNPVQQDFEAGNKHKLSWAEWFQAFGTQRDRSDTLLSLLLLYEKAGIPMFNPSSASMLSRRKPYQVSILQGLGCTMPTTLVSNDPAAAAAFIDNVGECIIKPAAGGSLTLSANKLQLSGQLNQLRYAPAIIQQRIFGVDLRVIVVDGRVCSVVSVDVLTGSIDFRGEPDYQNGESGYCEVELPTKVQQQCIKAVQKLGLKYSGIDLKHTANDQYYFLECNSSPIYLDVENRMGHPITGHLCKAMLT